MQPLLTLSVIFNLAVNMYENLICKNLRIGIRLCLGVFLRVALTGQNNVSVFAVVSSRQSHGDTVGKQLTFGVRFCGRIFGYYHLVKSCFCTRSWRTYSV